MKLLYLISVGIHILCAVTWIGGMIFLVLALVPAIRREEFRGVGVQLVRVIGLRFRAIGWTCLSLLAVTGIANLALHGATWESVIDGSLWEGSYGRTLAFKLCLVGAVLALSVVHDFWIGPKASRLLRENPTSARAAAWRRAASWMGRINLILAVAIVALALTLVRGSV